jgi:hypothetical protein
MPISSRWGQLDGARHSVLSRAREFAALTIPSLLPPAGHTETSPLPQPYQSLGARGVNNLASKLLLALFPPGSPFFRLNIEDHILEELGERATEMNERLRQIENRILTRIERGNLRAALHYALKLLIATGDALLYMPSSGAYRVYSLDKFCVARDAAGQVLEIVIKESLAPESLPDEVQVICEVKSPDGPVTQTGKRKSVDVYTHVYFEDGKYKWHQEINEIRVPDSDGQSPADSSPFLPMRWTALSGEDYGRGHVEDYAGDLRSLEGLSAAIVAFAAAAAKVIPILKPNAVMTAEDLAVPSGTVVVGNHEDVRLLQLEKFADFQVAKGVIDDLTLRLSHAFLLQSGTVRNAERVTAAEIQAMAQELEDVLGGVYSVQAQDTQLPIVRRFMAVMTEEQAIPPLPGVMPAVITGFEALGRGHELNRMRGFFGDAQAILGPEAVMQWVNPQAVLVQLATAHNVDASEILNDPETVQEQQQQQQASQMLEQATPAFAQAAAKNAME